MNLNSYQILCCAETPEFEGASRKNYDSSRMDSIRFLFSASGMKKLKKNSIFVESNFLFTLLLWRIYWKMFQKFHTLSCFFQSIIFHVDTHPVFKNFTQCVSFHVLSPSGEVIKSNFISFLFPPISKSNQFLFKHRILFITSKTFSSL